MQRKILALGSVSVLVALLMVLPGASGQVDVGDIACSDLNPAARSAASDVLSTKAKSDAKLTATLFGFSGLHPCGTPEGRRTGLAAQVDYMLNKGDPLIGKSAGTTANAQLYADLAAIRPGDHRFMNIERAYARAVAVILQIRLGFLTVPGGAAEAFNRIQTCLNGKIVTNERNRVAGVAIDCGSEAIRRAVADVIAPGFYIAFGDLPVIDFDCADMLAQAEGGKTVEARWAAGQAYVDACSPNLGDLVVSGGTAELRFAAVAGLAQASAGGRLASLLGAATTAGTAEARLANAWAAGLQLAKSVAANARDCNPETAATGNLLQWSLARDGTEEAAAAIAPLARYYANGYVFKGNRCSLAGGGDPLTLTIAHSVAGASLPLFGFATTP